MKSDRIVSVSYFLVPDSSTDQQSEWLYLEEDTLNQLFIPRVGDVLTFPHMERKYEVTQVNYFFNSKTFIIDVKVPE